MKSKRINFRLDEFTEILLKELVKFYGDIDNSKLIRFAIYELSTRVLGEEKVKEILFSMKGKND